MFPCWAADAPAPVAWHDSIDEVAHSGGCQHHVIHVMQRPQSCWLTSSSMRCLFTSSNSASMGGARGLLTLIRIGPLAQLSELCIALALFIADAAVIRFASC